jgi:hypothetical protein
MESESQPALKCQEALARVVAKARGQQSVAALALVEFVARRAAGEDVIVYPFRGKWLVGSESAMKTETARMSGHGRPRAAAADDISQAPVGNLVLRIGFSPLKRSR